MRFLSCVHVWGLVALVVFPTVVHGNPAYLYSRRSELLAQESFRLWQQANKATLERLEQLPGLQLKYRGGTKAMAVAKKQALEAYLAKLVPAMQLAPEVAHIPVEHPVVAGSEPDKKWIAYYEDTKMRLRPHVEYVWSSNANPQSSRVTLSDEHVKVLRANFNVLMWYRNELDNSCQATDQHVGARKFRLFLDYVVAGILEDMPKRPEIDLRSGMLSPPEWKLDEKRLREQLVMAYRYLLARYQVYPEYSEFAPADNAMFTSLMKIAYLMGAQLNYQWFEDMPVNLITFEGRSAWKKPIVQALQVLDGGARDLPTSPNAEGPKPSSSDRPWIIKIPPPKPKEEPPAPPKEEKPRIEIIVHPAP